MSYPKHFALYKQADNVVTHTMYMEERLLPLVLEADQAAVEMPEALPPGQYRVEGGQVVSIA
jgi:hypothetical protein